MGLLEAPCWIANEGNFALPSKFMDLEISLFDQEYPPNDLKTKCYKDRRGLEHKKNGIFLPPFLLVVFE